MSASKSWSTLHLAFALCIACLAGTSATVLAQRPMKPFPLSDADWDYWTNPNILSPVDLNVSVGIVTDSPGQRLEVMAPGSSGIRVSQKYNPFNYGDIRPNSSANSSYNRWI